MATTRWIDKKTTSLDRAIELLLNIEIKNTNEVENCSKKTVEYTNWDMRKEFETKEIARMNNTEIEYNCIYYSYDKITPGEQPIIDRTFRYSGNIIVFKYGEDVNYIIDMNSNAKLMLRKMLGYTGKNEIEPNSSAISSDVFLWMISKVYLEEGEIEQDDDTILVVDKIIGFRGDATDQKTTVAANGKTVMDLISTLSFLLESNSLNQIKVSVHYGSHSRINILINTKPTIDILQNEYIGAYMEEANPNIVRAKLYLLTYLEIFPRLMAAYCSDIQNDIWSEERKKEFYQRVGQEITNRIQEKLK